MNFPQNAKSNFFQNFRLVFPLNTKRFSESKIFPKSSLIWRKAKKSFTYRDFIDLAQKAYNNFCQIFWLTLKCNTEHFSKRNFFPKKSRKIWGNFDFLHFPIDFFAAINFAKLPKNRNAARQNLSTSI